MEVLNLHSEYIKLGQAMKAAALAQTGAEAKDLILQGLVKVNGETETRRGRKLYDGDLVSFDGNEIRIKA